jgi:hypothetical protein
MNDNKPELPRVGDIRTDLLTAEARGTYLFQVTSGAAVQLRPPNVRFTRIGIQNLSSNTGSIFIGGENVVNDSVALSLGIERGRELPAGENRDEDTTLAPYAIAADGETCWVAVEWVR